MTRRWRALAHARLQASVGCAVALIVSHAAATTPALAQAGSRATDAADGPPVPVPPQVIARDDRGRTTVRAVRVDQPLRIDGSLDEHVYQSVLPIRDFIQIEPNEGEPVSEPTEVWVLFDREHLYIAARCHDSQPHRIVANDMRRDGRNIGQNDNLSVVLDTFYDRRNGYEFLVNAVGGRWDGQFTDERDFNRDWNAVWRSKSRLDADGWTVETAIPFRSLRYRGGGPQVWGINIRRTVKWKNELAYLSLVPRTYGPGGVLRVSSAATLTGLELPEASLNLDVKPYVVAAARADRVIDPRFRSEFARDAGADVKYSLTRGLTADFTYRTDFAQVEDDDQQVNLTRFTPFFPEKREFFLEGQGIFAFGGVESAPRGSSSASTAANTPWLFFSRRIGLAEGRPVPIVAGGRLSGKAGRYSVGLLEIRTDAKPAVGAVTTDFSVVRLKRDILRRSYVGIIGARRSPSTVVDGSNLAYGVDAGFSFFQSVNLVGFYARTRTPGVSGRDHSYRARFDYNADLFGLQVEQLAVGERFSPEVGFLRRRNFVETFGQMRISHRPSTLPAVRKFSLETALDYITDGDRRLEDRQAKIAVRTELQSGDSGLVEYERNFEFLPKPFEIASGILLPVSAHHFSTVRGTYTLGTQRRIAGDVVVAHGGFYAGDRTDVGYRGRIGFNAHLALEPGLTVNFVDLPEGRFVAKLFSARGTYAFSPDMLVAALVQYNSTSHITSANLRFRWEYRPGSDLFIVYSDGRDRLQPADTRLQSRSFTVKMTRLLRF